MLNRRTRDQNQTISSRPLSFFVYQERRQLPFAGAHGGWLPKREPPVFRCERRNEGTGLFQLTTDFGKTVIVPGLAARAGILFDEPVR
jgi:hypothetical protein